jgi:hypothetical protein
MSANREASANGSPSNGLHETRWAATTGLWEFQGSSAAYTGPSSSDGSPYGIAVTNWSLTDGTVKVKVSFSEVDPAGNISAGVVLGFQSERSRYVLAQLGGYGRAYSVAEHVPGVGWQGIENVG